MELFKASGDTSKRIRVLIAAPLKQQEHIFAEYQNALDKLIVPDDVRVDRFFVVNNCDEIIPHIRNARYVIYNWEHPKEYHQWNEYTVQQMEYMRNLCVDYAKQLNYDYLWFVDTDLILHPNTLTQMLELKHDIIYEKHVTQNDDGSLWLSVWQCNDGKYYSDDDMLKLINSRNECFRVGGGVGCTWISKKVLNTEHVNYSRIPSLTFDFLWGEDKYFGVRAQVAGFEIWADSHYPCVHLFNQHAFERWKSGLNPIDPDMLESARKNIMEKNND